MVTRRQFVQATARNQISRRQFLRKTGYAGLAMGASTFLPWRFGVRDAFAFAQSPTVIPLFGTALRGTKELQPRWRRVLRQVDSGVGEALGDEAIGQVAVFASGMKSSDTRLTWSPWLIQTSICPGTPANSP